MLRKDRVPEAIEQYRNALSISHRAEDRLALGLALLKAERWNEASLYLNDVLRQHPASGPANVGIAAIDAQQNRVDEAVMRYHRAIYGSWPDDPLGNRVRTRMALFDLLNKAGRKPQARAELLALAADAPQDPPLQKQIGRMLLDFGLAREAADLYRSLLKRGPPDANEYGGLGEAEFALNDYAAAERAFRSALEIDPGDAEASRRAEMCDRILSLDPSQRGLDSRERLRRSQELLAAVVSDLKACGGPQAGIEAAQVLLARKRTPPSLSDAADARIALAEQLWSSGLPSCSAAASDVILSRIMTKLENR